MASVERGYSTILLARGNRLTALAGIAEPAGVCQSFTMDRNRVIVILRKHAPELKAAGVVHLRVFGSVARGEASSLSDVDLLADFDKSRRFTLVSVGRLQGRLSELLGAKVDLSSPEWMRESARKKALQEAVVAF